MKNGHAPLMPHHAAKFLMDCIFAAQAEPSPVDRLSLTRVSYYDGHDTKFYVVFGDKAYRVVVTKDAEMTRELRSDRAAKEPRS